MSDKSAIEWLDGGAPGPLPVQPGDPMTTPDIHFTVHPPEPEALARICAERGLDPVAVGAAVVEWLQTQKIERAAPTQETAPAQCPACGDTGYITTLDGPDVACSSCNWWTGALAVAEVRDLLEASHQTVRRLAKVANVTFIGRRAASQPTLGDGAGDGKTGPLSPGDRRWIEEIVALASGWDEDGAIGPREPLSWESVGRLALDYARAWLGGSPTAPHPSPESGAPAPGATTEGARPKPERRLREALADLCDLRARVSDDVEAFDIGRHPETGEWRVWHEDYADEGSEPLVLPAPDRFREGWEARGEADYGKLKADGRWGFAMAAESIRSLAPPPAPEKET